jgi:ssDNA-binding Zn-finger/Zn-ribbon topoisomerase 1
MPITTTLECPECGVRLVRRPGGRCPECGTDVRDHVLRKRRRENVIERIVAIVSTILVVGVSVFVGGCSIVEGVVAYAVAGAVIWVIAKKTFYDQP